MFKPGVILLIADNRLSDATKLPLQVNHPSLRRTTRSREDNIYPILTLLQIHLSFISKMRNKSTELTIDEIIKYRIRFKSIYHLKYLKFFN